MKGIALVYRPTDRAKLLRQKFLEKGIELEIVKAKDLVSKINNGILNRPLSTYWDFCILDFANLAIYHKACDILASDNVKMFNTYFSFF